MNKADHPLVRRTMAIIKEVQPELQKIEQRFCGEPPEVQGAALADLVATWLAGHDPIVRKDTFDLWIKVVVQLITVNEKQFFGEAGHPGWRSDKPSS